MVNDIVGDFLTRVRNAQLRKKDSVVLPSSRMVESIAGILKEKSFIEDFKVIENPVQSEIEVNLRYVDGNPAIRELKRISRPGIRRYRGYKEIKPVKHGIGISIFSTPKGVITGGEAIKSRVGGEYICDIY